MSPAMWKAYKRTFSRMVDSVLSHTKNAHDGGEEKALWDAVLFCLQTNIPMPKPWPSGALEKFALDRIATTKKPGRPTKWLRDLLIFDSVNRWRQERIAFGQKGKSRHFSESRAFKMVQRQLEEDGESLSIHSIKNAYNRVKRAKRTHSKPPYVSFFEN